MHKLKEAIINGFLLEFKKLIKARKFVWAERIKNNEALAALGITRRNAIDEILYLDTTAYVDGPLKDRDCPGEVWVFGKVINGVEIYIKLKRDCRADEDCAVCISFHQSQKPLDYPCR